MQIDYGKQFGCIEIGDNVFIGAGVPARVIGSFDRYVEKRLNEKAYPVHFSTIGQEISLELQEWLWDDFKKRHG